jgi:hypothetical protein
MLSEQNDRSIPTIRCFGIGERIEEALKKGLPKRETDPDQDDEETEQEEGEGKKRKPSDDPKADKS